MTRTGTLGRLFSHVAEPLVQMNPQDMARRLLAEGDLVHVTSRRGAIVLPVQGSADVGLSQAFIAMHWGGEFLGGLTSTGERVAGINALTTPAYCPDSKQPELKHTAVKVLKAELPWRVFGMAWLPHDLAQKNRDGLRELMAQFPFASCVPFSNNAPLNGTTPERSGLLFRAAAFEAVPAEVLLRLQTLLGLDSPDTLRYSDARRQQHRAARLARRAEGADVTLEGFLLAGDTSAEAWIRTVLQEGLPAQTYGRLVLAPGVKPPVAVVARGKAVCGCFNVAQADITRTLERCEGNNAERLAALQSRLRCGTNCGSCLPELKALVQATPALRQAA